MQQIWFVPGLIPGHQRLVVSTQFRGVITPLASEQPVTGVRVPVRRCGHSSHMGHSRKGQGVAIPQLSALCLSPQGTGLKEEILASL